MGRIVVGMNQSLDGYVDHTAFGPDQVLFRHFIEQVGGLAGSVYGRVMYEVMRYWDEDSPDWGTPERDFAAAWRGQPKWVVSRTLTSVGPNATLVSGDAEAAIRRPWAHASSTLPKRPSKRNAGRADAGRKFTLAVCHKKII